MFTFFKPCLPFFCPDDGKETYYLFKKKPHEFKILLNTIKNKCVSNDIEKIRQEIHQVINTENLKQFQEYYQQKNIKEQTKEMLNEQCGKTSFLEFVNRCVLHPKESVWETLSEVQKTMEQNTVEQQTKTI
jgi:hypothetical protein